MNLHGKRQCPIHNGTLPTFIWSIMWKLFSFFLDFRVFNSESFFMFSCSKNAHVSFEEKPPVSTVFSKLYTWISNSYRIRQNVYGYLVIRAFAFAWRITWYYAYSPFIKCLILHIFYCATAYLSIYLFLSWESLRLKKRFLGQIRFSWLFYILFSPPSNKIDN